MSFATSNQATLAVSSAMALGVQDLYTVSTTKLLPLGTQVTLADGRKFVYGKAGGSELAYGKINQSPAPSSEWDNQAVATAAAVGDHVVGVTFGGAVTANQFQDGFLLINDANGEGNVYTIKSHPAGTTNVLITLHEAVRVAITTSGEATIYPNPSSGLIVAPTTLTGALHGVALVTVAAGSYAWFQVKGPAPVLVAATLDIKYPCEVATAAGGVIPSAETTFGQIVGMPLILAAATEYALINLDIPGY